MRLVRGLRGLGFTLHGERPVVIAAIDAGGPADVAGLTVGDQVLEIDGVPCSMATHSDVIQLLKSGTDQPVPWRSGILAEAAQLEFFPFPTMSTAKHCTGQAPYAAKHQLKPALCSTCKSLCLKIELGRLFFSCSNPSHVVVGFCLLFLAHVLFLCCA